MKDPLPKHYQEDKGPALPPHIEAILKTPRNAPGIKRNSNCPCGSGKKAKSCCFKENFKPEKP